MNEKHQKLLKRLGPYWKMEAANIVFVPAMAFGLVWYAKSRASLAMILAASATSFLLWIGTTVQLQHFDHAEDFRRLISGRGFRRSHLAKQIAAYRQGRS
jgi:hypothetical protein